MTKYNETVLENGITVVSENKSNYNSLELSFCVFIGTRNESNHEFGYSHFIEHMLFKGTPKYSAEDLALMVEEKGGDLNAYTSREYTAFSVNCLSEDINTAVKVLSEMFLNSDFKEEEIAKEKLVVLQEISMTNDDPEELITDKLYENMYAAPGLGTPILGTEESINSINREKVFSFYKKNYGTNNLKVFACGKVNHKKLCKLLEKIVPVIVEEAPLPKFELIYKSEEISKSIEQAHYAIAYNSIPYTDPKRFTALIVNSYLGGGMSSRLFQEIREKRGLAYSVYSDITFYNDASILMLYLSTSKDLIDEAKEVFNEELDKLITDGIDADMLEKIKSQLRGLVLINSDDLEQRINSISRNYYHFSRYVPLDETVEMINAVTVESVKEYCFDTFKNAKHSTVLIS